MAAKINAAVSVENAGKMTATVFSGAGITYLHLYFDDGRTHHTRIAVHDLPADYMHRLAAAINAVPVKHPLGDIRPAPDVDYGNQPGRAA
jgi:hypothetical protein